VAGHEAVKAVRDAIRDLPEDYRQAVELRLLEGRSLEETAEAMNRSARAVQGLVDRAKRKMRAALVRLSLYE
jgi:RNA polymerase sigma-70 factor (ECF subfamily)